MHSPLPDTSALEAGIIEDEMPSRLSRVQDNVRNLLRMSQFGTVASSPRPTATNRANLNHDLPVELESPTIFRASQHPQGLVPSPTAESTASSTPNEAHSAGIPPSTYQRAVQQLAHQSTLFNTRAVAALDHPDLTDPSLAAYLRKKVEDRQRRSWKRPRHARKRVVQSTVAAGSSQSVVAVFAALLLAAIVATYVVLATNSNNNSPTFHILFILGIILATIVFAHSIMRLLLFNNQRHARERFLLLPAPRQKRRHRHHRRDHHPTNRFPVLPTDTTAFIPATPIPVYTPTSAVRPDSREAQPTASVILEPSYYAPNWNKDVDTVPNPPPAYGRWRGSVRADPELLHWQVWPSPRVEDTPAMPSPRYEEVDVVVEEEGGRPPSYVTRDSPARRRQEGGVERMQARVDDAEGEAEPEMFQVRGLSGVGLVL